MVSSNIACDVTSVQEQSVLAATQHGLPWPSVPVCNPPESPGS